MYFQWIYGFCRNFLIYSGMWSVTFSFVISLESIEKKHRIWSQRGEGRFPDFTIYYTYDSELNLCTLSQPQSKFSEHTAIREQVLGFRHTSARLPHICSSPLCPTLASKLTSRLFTYLLFTWVMVGWFPPSWRDRLLLHFCSQMFH